MLPEKLGLPQEKTSAAELNEIDVFPEAVFGDSDSGAAWKSPVTPTTFYKGTESPMRSSAASVCNPDEDRSNGVNFWLYALLGMLALGLCGYGVSQFIPMVLLSPGFVATMSTAAIYPPLFMMVLGLVLAIVMLVLTVKAWRSDSPEAISVSMELASEGEAIESKASGTSTTEHPSSRHHATKAVISGSDADLGDALARSDDSLVRSLMAAIRDELKRVTTGKACNKYLVKNAEDIITPIEMCLEKQKLALTDLRKKGGKNQLGNGKGVFNEVLLYKIYVRMLEVGKSVDDTFSPHRDEWYLLFKAETLNELREAARQLSELFKSNESVPPNSVGISP